MATKLDKPVTREIEHDGKVWKLTLRPASMDEGADDPEVCIVMAVKGSRKNNAFVIPISHLFRA